MALGDPYATLAELKGYLGIALSKESLDDSLLSALSSSTEEIERQCNRQFNKTTTPSARVYAPDTCGYVHVDDFHTPSGLIVLNDGATVSPSAYELYPLNGIVDGQVGWPAHKIRMKQGNRFTLRSDEATVTVTAQWGWTAVPAPVRQACLIMAAETFQLKDAPFGVAGSDQFGNMMRVRENKMAAGKLARYVRNRLLVG